MYNVRSKDFELTDLDREILVGAIPSGLSVMLTVEQATQIASLFIEWYEKRIMDGKEEG